MGCRCIRWLRNVMLFIFGIWKFSVRIFGLSVLIILWVIVVFGVVLIIFRFGVELIILVSKLCISVELLIINICVFIGIY